MMQYAILPSLSEAESLIKQIDQIKNSSGTWAEPVSHPVDMDCLVPIDHSQLRGCEELIRELNLVSKKEAKEKGWYFGPFTGPLARENQKMEDIHFLFDALVQVTGKPNFPAIRSLTLSYLSACYSLRESLKKKSFHVKFEEKLKAWWLERDKELSDRNGMLHQFERFMNTEKHGGALAGQTSNLDIESAALMTTLIVTSHPINADPESLTFSAEGAFMTANSGTPMERRVPVGIHEARYEVVVLNPPKFHISQSIDGATFLQMMQLIRNYYANLLFEAKKILGELPPPSPAMKFTGEQSMKVPGRG